MDAGKKTAMITLLANLVAEHLDEAQLVTAAAIITQFGSTLGFLAAQRAADASGSSRSSLSPAGSAAQAGAEDPEAQGGAACPP